MGNDLTIILFYFFVVLIAISLMFSVVKQKKKPKSIKEFFKIYWSEIFLIVGLTLSGYYFGKGILGG